MQEEYDVYYIRLIRTGDFDKPVLVDSRLSRGEAIAVAKDLQRSAIMRGDYSDYKIVPQGRVPRQPII